MNTVFNPKILFILCIAACNEANENTKREKEISIYNKLQQANWVVGNWQNISDAGITNENWCQENDSTFKGISYLIKGKDTVLSETITLQQRGEEVSYNPIAANQNESKSVPFVLTSSSDTQLIFENPLHDFPQKISYTKIRNDSLYAEISGMIEGKKRVIPFPFKRVE